jgi:hypothetical protein
MFAFFKAVVLGAILSAVVSAVVGHLASTGGALNVHHFVIHGFGFYWSWVVFLAGAVLAFAILLMLD